MFKRRFMTSRWGRRIWVALVLLLALGGWYERRPTKTSPTSGTLSLHEGDRILILAPHPDDEVIGCGGVIQQANAMKLPVKVVFLTYGDNNEWSFALYRKHPVLAPRAVLKMGMVRHDEAMKADTMLGIASNNLVFLGYPDHSTLDIWNRHWGAESPAQSILTRARFVPYSDAYQYGTPYKGESVVRDLMAIIRDFRPTQIFVSHPADFNPDHRALYLFTRVALWNLEDEMTPSLHLFLVHFPHWPSPRRFAPTIPILPPFELSREFDWASFPLTPGQVSLKSLALREHKTQFEYSGRYLCSLVRSSEIFASQEDMVSSCSAGRATDLQAASKDAGAPSDELTEDERVLFTGLQGHHVRLNDDSVTVSILLSRPLGRAVSASIQIFGYRKDTAFATMPKLTVDVSPTGYKVHDQSKVVASGVVTLTHAQREITLTVPFKLLRDPQRLLISARTYLGTVPLDWSTWQTVDVQDAQGE